MSTHATHSELRQPASGALSLLVGVLLVGIGGLVLLLQHVPDIAVDAGHYGWPLFVITPGLALLAVGATVRSLSGLCIPGSVVAVTGLLLLVQNSFDLWSTWAYAWTLVVLVGTGAGLYLQGVVTGRSRRRAIGGWLVAFGAGLFSLGALLFEGLLHLGGIDLGPLAGPALPLLLIALGGVLVLRNRFLPVDR